MIDHSLNESGASAESSVCGNCGEKLVGQVNRCWKCDELVVQIAREATDESPFAPESLPPVVKGYEADTDEMVVAATANAAILIGVLSLPFAGWLSVAVVPALVGLVMALWALSSGKRKGRAILAIVVCLVTLSIAGPTAYWEALYWYEDNFGYNRF
ncbi:MAG: hypothetical protein AAF497_13200 [Planctomycetota bacterium]